MQKRAARRGTRALAFLLCLLMVVTLLPAMGANAAEGDTTASGVKIQKTINWNASDGTAAITLEAFATGTVTTTTETEPVPTDFVLVLDQSGSMADKITSYVYTAKQSQAYSYSSLKNQTLYYKDGDAYYAVTRGYYQSGGFMGMGKTTHYYLSYQKDGTTYYLSGTGTTTARPDEYTSSSNTIWTGVLYSRSSSSSQTKLDALKDAVKNFVTSVQNQKDKNGAPVDHRIAIVGFAQMGDGSKWGWADNQNSELFIGGTQYNYSSSEISSQYGNALQNVNTEAANLTSSINALDAEGGTYPQLGFEMANGIFKAYQDKNDDQYIKANGETANRGKVVVMFTDGVPAGNDSDPSDRFSNNNTTEANATIGKAKILKENSAKVFTIGVYDNTPFTDITTFMNATSSNYPNASSMENLGSKDSDQYYAMATDSTALNAAFQSVSSSISNPSTSCTLDAGSVLKDIISDNLDLPEGFNANGNVSVKTADYTGGAKSAESISFNDFNDAEAAVLSNAVVTVKDKTVDVSGFDYSSNYATGVANTDGTFSGKKLIVTITGLIPNKAGVNMPSNDQGNEKSGIYDDSDLKAPVASPVFTVASRNVVIDFGMTANIARNVLNHNSNCTTENGGTFTYGNDQTLTFKPTVTKDDNGNYSLPFTGVSSALYYGVDYAADNSTPNAWTKVNVIPANNVYYDDTYLNGGDTGSSDFTDNKYGYEASVAATTGTTSVPAGETTFTFTGSRIDVYCTTESTSGAVIGQLKDADGNVIATKLMRNEYKSGTLYNVPTLSFDAGTVGTYTLTITTNDQSNYKLDGVRVYQPADETDETVQSAYAADNESNAVFTQVRKLLLTANSFGEGTYSGEAISGVVYTDATREDGQTHDTNNVAETYKDLGPKNEVYLANGNGIAFEIPNYNGQKVMIGLSAPETAASGTVTATNGSAAKTIEIKSNVDMYYEVTPTSDGYVFIKNTSNALIAVTNVKVSGTAADAEPLCVDADLLSYVADFDTLAVVQPEPEPTPDPEPVVSNNTVSAIIRAIWAQVMDSIGRLFGR